MTAVQFAYWLQGFFEISEADSADTLDDGLARSQVDCIRKHLNLVFVHDIDPKAGGPEVQKTLNKIHGGKMEIGGVSFPEHGHDPTLIRC